MKIMYKLIKAFVPKRDVAEDWLPRKPYVLTGFKGFKSSLATATLTVKMDAPKPKVQPILRTLVNKFAPSDVAQAYMDTMIYMSSNQSGKSSIATRAAYGMFYDTEGKTWKTSSTN